MRTLRSITVQDLMVT
nr:immunoglobulin heavy chain junction region [Mus musculus]